jgi:hypothetical protein
VPRKSNIEGLEYISTKDGTEHYLLMSTGSYGGYVNVLKLDEQSDTWDQINQA